VHIPFATSSDSNGKHEYPEFGVEFNFSIKHGRCFGFTYHIRVLWQRIVKASRFTGTLTRNLKASCQLNFPIPYAQSLYPTSLGMFYQFEKPIRFYTTWRKVDLQALDSRLKRTILWQNKTLTLHIPADHLLHIIMSKTTIVRRIIR